jgi:hypothetical protein
MRKFISGAIAVVALICWEALERWSVFQPILDSLKGSKPFLASIILSPTFSLIIAVTGLVLVIEGLREIKRRSKIFTNSTDKQPGGAIPNASIRESFNPQFNQNFNPKFDLHLPHAQPVAPSPSPCPERPKEQPKLQYVQARKVVLDEDQMHRWIEVNGNREPNALVADFWNPPKAIGHKTPTANSVTASMVFKGDGNPSDLLINYGTWTDEYAHFATFRSGQTQHLVIAVNIVRVKKSTMSFVVLENPRSFDPSKHRFRYGTVIYGSDPKDLPAKSGKVTITLVDEEGVTVYQEDFKYAISGQEMTLTPFSP